MTRVKTTRYSLKRERSTSQCRCSQTVFMAVLVVFFAIVMPTSAQSSKIIRVPLTRQATDYTCGVAALQAILAYYGEDVREDVLAKALHANHKIGTRYKNIQHYAEAHGLTVHVDLEMTIEQLKNSLQSGHPVLCLIQAWAEKKTDYKTDWDDGHYVVAVGFDDERVIFMDPSTAGHYTYIPLQEFAQRWHDVDGTVKLNHFGMSLWKEGTSFDPEKVDRLE
jgi:ABC-type bacteriocin/lantibiotic exporter with double-glycine peptidase domain